MADNPWYCVRQRAGPLVKECRALRPRLSQDDTYEDQETKSQIKKMQHSAVCRTQVDRLELRLALFGFTGIHYTMTYDSMHLPRDFSGVRKTLRAYMSRARRYNSNLPYDWIYCIEGLHGDHRYHIHTVLRGDEFPPDVVRSLWTCGDVYDEPVLMRDGGYRRLAKYFNKEKSDGVWIPIGRHPWSCSRSLSHKLPPPERWKDSNGYIEIPDNVIWARKENCENDFGAYYYGSYILDNQTNCVPTLTRVRARTRLS